MLIKHGRLPAVLQHVPLVYKTPSILDLELVLVDGGPPAPRSRGLAIWDWRSARALIGPRAVDAQPPMTACSLVVGLAAV